MTFSVFAEGLGKLDIKSIPTEQVNPDTVEIDEVSALEILLMDKKLQFVYHNILSRQLQFALGEHIVYMGAGASGRMEYMDASECPPTFGISNDRVIALMAGGLIAMTKAVENAKDSKENGVKGLQDINFNEKDVLVGIAASSRTPYVVGSMEYAKNLGSVTVSITCNEDLSSPINSISNYPIGICAGPEVITGSTRMEAGTV